MAKGVQPPESRRPAWLVGGHPGVDFLNTVDARGEPGQREHLRGYRELLVWMGRARLLSALEQRLLRARAAALPAEAGGVLSEARGLREAARRIVAARTSGGAPLARDLALLKRVIRSAYAARVLEWNGQGFAARWRDANALRRPLFVVALELADLLEPANLARVHICAGEGCDWAFLDRSPTQRRRWCHMSACGNRAKLRRFRARRAGRKRS